MWTTANGKCSRVRETRKSTAKGIMSQCGELECDTYPSESNVAYREASSALDVVKPAVLILVSRPELLAQFLSRDSSPCTARMRWGSEVYRSATRLFLMAMAMALRVPTMTTRSFALVTAV